MPSDSEAESKGKSFPAAPTVGGKPEPKGIRAFLGSFVKRRACIVPTWRGWLILFLASVILAIIAAHKIHPFLAPNHPLTGGILVIEGWAPDSALKAGLEEFHRHHYEKIFVTGGPLQHGTWLSEYGNFAELGVASLLKLGANSNQLQAIPAPAVRQDRTYTAAASLNTWLREHPPLPSSVHLMTEGAHARRSWLLYRAALGKDIPVGVTALPEQDYDPKKWWRSSSGVRSVIGELLAYGYARIFFRKPEGEP
jgi:hypothetical protein